MTETLVVPITDVTGAVEARRVAGRLASRLGFDEARAGRVALVVTEAATNLARHAGSGEVLLHAIRANGAHGVEMLALDRGPGIKDPDAALRDGYTTAGSRGTGLGAIRRLSAEFDLYSGRGVGTALLTRVWSTAAGSSPALPRLEIGGVCVMHPGEDVWGDAWAVASRPDGVGIAVADGLGHGQGAADAAREAIRVFCRESDTAPATILGQVHQALRATRGAAVALTDLDLGRGVVRFAGIGNVAGVIVSPGATRSLVSHNGTVGHEVRRIQEFSYPWPTEGLLVLHTDGLATRWDLDAYPGLARRHPALVAGVLYRDFRRERDDVTVVVTRSAAA